MHKVAGLGLIVVLAAASLLVWAKSPHFMKQAQATQGTMPGISPSDLHRQVDATRLPVLEIADLI